MEQLLFYSFGGCIMWIAGIALGCLTRELLEDYKVPMRYINIISVIYGIGMLLVAIVGITYFTNEIIKIY